jgi:hypothetical protein
MAPASCAAPPATCGLGHRAHGLRLVRSAGLVRSACSAGLVRPARFECPGPWVSGAAILVAITAPHKPHTSALRPSAPASRRQDPPRGCPASASFDDNRPLHEARSSRISRPSFGGVLGHLPREVSAESGPTEPSPAGHAAGARREPRGSGCKRVPTVDPIGRCGLRSRNHRSGELPLFAGRLPSGVHPGAPIRHLRSPRRTDESAPTWTRDRAGCPRHCPRTGAPYYECQYVGSASYKIVSGIDFRFGRNRVFGRIY